MDGNFIPDLHELTGDVVRSRHQLFTDNLLRWFSHLESDSGAFAIISSLEQQVDFTNWYQDCVSTVRGMVGSGKLKWPSDPRMRLGLHLALFRQFATGKLSPADFCTKFLYSSNNFSVMVSDICNQIFEPFSRDLIKHLARSSSDSLGDVPASDRTVSIDHNSLEFQKADTALSEVESLVSQSNEISPDDREIRIAEITAGRTLLKATRVRLSAIVPVLLKALQWLTKTFAEQAIGIAAGAALTALLTLLGFI